MEVPPSYSAATYQHASIQPGITFQDFLPNCTDPGGFFTKPVYEPFSVLMQRANEFLNGNPGVQVKTCESVEFKFSQGGYPKVHKLTFMESGKHINMYLRGLRLWLVPRDDPTRPPQQIGYFNNLPAVLSHSIGTPEFESLDSVIQRINGNLKNQPLQGRILNMETQDMKIKSYSPETMNPDQSCWQEYGEHETLFVYVLRIFYEIGEPSFELIGCVDFIPECLEAGGLFSQPVFEPFSRVISKASTWCYQNCTTRFCNVQTMNYKLKTEGVNTKRMHYVEHGKRLTSFVKILRLVYASPFVPMETAPPPLAMSSRTFEPVPLSTGGMLGIPNYEFLEPTKNRVTAWVRATRARVLSAETLTIRINYDVGEGPDSSYSYNTGRGCYHKTIFRIYLDGVYQEPPPEVLPPLPTSLEEDCCCNIV